MAAVGISAPASFLAVQKTSGHSQPSMSETVPVEGMMLGGLCNKRARSEAKTPNDSGVFLKHGRSIAQLLGIYCRGSGQQRSHELCMLCCSSSTQDSRVGRSPLFSWLY